ncbi:MAG: GNAT family N-acetyltransferase [Rhodospirillales bacterium]|nr:GNAT family N-acetyltransferase [Rhodospirillales bacterium]
MNTTATMELRPLRATDAAALAAIDRAGSGRARGDHFARRLAQLAREPAAFAAYAAEGRGELAGFVLARLYEGEFGAQRREAALEAIGVARPGEGVGPALLAHLAEALRAQGVAALTTEVDWRERALLAFFARSGFELAPRLVLARPVLASPAGEDALADAEARDRIAVRSMARADEAALVAIDRRITGRDRSAYFARKMDEAMEESAVRVSLVAEADGHPAGFVMARVGLGEFGQTEPEAAMDTIGVDPQRAHQGLARALLSQLLVNLGALRVETLRTEVGWNRFALLAFLERCGFRPHRRLALERPLG